MRKAYPIGTKVYMGDIEFIISAVTFYPDHEKYLICRIADGELKEEWYSDFYFSLEKMTVQKVGFNIHE